jgi:protein-disulfide isomerase
VKYVFRDYPLSFHQYAEKAAEAADCADEQGKYWEYHDLLFENQTAHNATLQTDGLEGVLSTFKSYAADLGLDTATFDDCLDSGKYASEVQNDIQDGQAYGVSGTPAFFINGQLVSGAQPFSVFQQVIDAALEKAEAS